MNPFDLVYDALWRLALAGGVDQLVSPGNRVRYDQADADPLKREVSSVDLPELILVPETLNANIHSTSHTSMLRRNYSFLLSTGDMRLAKPGGLHAVEWALFRGMHGWRTELTRLVWPAGSDWHFVKNANVPDARSGLSDRERNRNILGWSAAWTCQVEMHFRIGDM